MFRGDEIKLTFQPERSRASKWCVNSSMLHRQAGGPLVHFGAFEKETTVSPGHHILALAWPSAFSTFGAFVSEAGTNFYAHMIYIGWRNALGETLRPHSTLSAP